MGFFAPKAPSLPPPPPPPPTREDPAVLEAKKKLQDAEKRRKGRGATVLQGGQGVLGEPASVTRPEAGSGTLG